MLRRILVIDDVAAHRIVLKARLRAACYDSHCVAGLAEALEWVQQEPPDLVLLAGSRLCQSGVLACAALRGLPGCAQLPILVQLSDPRPAQRLAALQAGASDVLPQGAPLPLLLAQIRSLLRQAGRYTPAAAPEAGAIGGFGEPALPCEPPSRIALVTPHPATALRWQSRLAPLLGEHRLQACLPAEILNLRGAPPDVLLLCADDTPFPAVSLLLAELTARFAPAGGAICLVMADPGAAEAPAALDLGADCLLPATVTPAETALRLRRLIRGRHQAAAHLSLLQQSLRLALTDPLTGISNRRHAMPLLQRMLDDCAGSDGTCAVMLLDIDHFKRVNDTWGHPVGDQVLAETAQRLGRALNTGSLLARIGGEEFLIATPVNTLQTALNEAERLRSQLAGQPFSDPGAKRRLAITASIGLALSQTGACRAADILRRADDALLIAKREGRNRVRLARPLAA